MHHEIQKLIYVSTLFKHYQIALITKMVRLFNQMIR